MNLGYKVTEEDILVRTSFTTVSGHWPKYTHAETILLLENEADTIDELIKDKERQIEERKSKWYYKHLKRIAISTGILMIMAVGFSVLAIIMLMLSMGSMSQLCLAMTMVMMVVGLPCAFISDKGAILSRHNSILTLDIDHLQEIKKQKELEIDVLKQEISPDMAPTQDMIEQVKKVVEEIEEKANQKTLEIR